MRDGVKLKKILAMRNINNKPKIIPNMGEITIALNTFMMPAHFKWPHPALAIPAPSNPPIRACEELDGIPKYQVKIFQNTAPQSAANTTSTFTIEGSINPVPMVPATFKPKNKKAIKLKNAAHSTATWGFKTRVETMVAMELAAS